MPEVSGDLITRNYSNFRGVDFSNTEVALYRSPDAINMWKDYKKMGTSIETRPDIVLFKELKNTVYGLFFYTINQVDHMIIHCGVSLYDYNMKTKELKIIKEKGMNIRKSQSFIYRNILYIKDGLNYLQYDGETCKEVIGYIPTTTIGKAPSGGGTTNQEVNLLTGVRENSFCADGESTEYVLDASELDAGYQEKVFINDVEKTEGFTVDKVSGKVKFTTAPEKPLTDGQDNVVIRFSKTIPGNRDKINKCTILEVFDNRVFFSGNQDYPNTVFHTMLDEPKYCSDLDYYNEGADISPVRGMVAGNNALWVIKEPSQANTAIFYHNPTIDSEAGKVYPSEHSSISTGCIGAAINFNDDIVYFSNRGMEGISGDITTEQVISHRSSLVDSKLLQEENYKDMILVEYEGYLLVIIKDKIYLADSRAMFTNENHNEYEWFYWNIDIEPTCAVVYNGELWLGSKQGIFKIGKASENNKEISMEKDEEERYFIDGVTKQETGTESYKTVTGKEILIEDGENNKGLEIKVKGSTTQATRSGKNLLNIKNENMQTNYCTKEYNGNSLTLTSTKTAMPARTTIPVDYPLNKALTISFDATFLKGYDLNNNSLVYFRSDSTNIGSIKLTKDNQKHSYSITIPNGIAEEGYTFWLYIKPSSIEGVVSIKFDNIQIEEGSIATDYEEYGASPSPDYPSEIENVEGRNKFSGFVKGIAINSTDGHQLADETRASSDYIAVDFNQNPNYYLSGLTKILQTFVAAYNSNKEFLGRTEAPLVSYFSLNSSSFTGGTAQGTGDIAYLRVTTYENTLAGTTGAIDDVDNLETQLEEGTVATPYVPYHSLELKVTNGLEETDENYQEQVVTFPLGEEKLMEGSYLADDGIHHTRKQYTFTGNETFVISNENNNYIRLYSPIFADALKNGGYESIDKFICTHFEQVSDYNSSKNCIALNQKRFYITISKAIVTDVTTFKTLLAEQYANGTPVIVEYELAEPEVVPYTAEQQEAWNKIESMKLYDGVNHIESTSEIDIKYNYIYKKPSIKNKSDIENKISSGEYQTIINNKRYFVFLEEELKSVRNNITDRLYIDTNKNIAKVMKRVDKLVLNGTEEWNVNATHSNVFYTAKPKNMADNETNIFCTITDEFSKDLSGETYGILIDTNINIKIPKVKTVADLKAYLAKEPITIQYKATEEIKDIILLSKPSSYWTTCEDEFKYPQMQKTTNKRGCVADVIGEEIDVFCKTNKEQFEKIATHKNATGYAVNRIKKKKWKSIQLKFSSNKSFELFSCTLESYIGSYIKR